GRTGGLHTCGPRLGWGGGAPPRASGRAAGGWLPAPTVTAAAPRATIDSPSRRPVVFLMLDASCEREARDERPVHWSLAASARHCDGCALRGWRTSSALR